MNTRNAGDDGRGRPAAGQHDGVPSREGDPRRVGEQDRRTLAGREPAGSDQQTKDDPSRAPESGTP